MSSAGVAILSPLMDQQLAHCLSQLDPLDSILIFLAMPGMAPVPMRVLGSESIASVKLRIQRTKGFTVTRQRLVFGGHELSRSNSNVRDYGLADGNVLHLAFRLADLRSITVETASGKKFKYQVEGSSRVRQLKKRLAAETGERLEDQSLVCDDGEELEDDQLITDISRSNCATAVINLFVRAPAKMKSEQVGKDTLVTVANSQENNGNLLMDALPHTKPVEPVIVNDKVELPRAIIDMISSTMAGLENGHLPEMSSEGSGGVYFMQDPSGHSYVSVFKLIDEEPMAENNPRGFPLSVDGEDLRRGTRVGEGALREVAAYVLDHPAVDGFKSSSSSHIAGFSGVPPTALVRCLHMGKGFKIGSLQMFVENHGSCEDMGPRDFPLQEVQKIAVLDIRLANADRHAGNVLVCRDEEDHLKLVPIDHGYCLPEKLVQGRS